MKMKAAVIEKTGTPDEIKIEKIDMPQISKNEVLVKIHAASVNHVDTFVRSGAFKTQMKYPFIVGRDAVGKIEKIGENVQGFSVGQKVWTNSMGYDGRPGITSEFAAIPAERLFPIPDGVDELQLLASVHSSATAEILLDDILRVKSGNKILIEGAGGHVGTKLVSIANINGLTVSTTSNQRDFDHLKSLGATATYDYSDPVSEIGENFDYIIDTSGKNGLQQNLDHLNQGGQIGLITAPSDDHFEFKVRDFYMNLKQIKGFVISHANISQIQKAGMFLNQYFSDNKLLDDDLLIKSLDDVKYAHISLENNQNHRQRIIIKIQ